MEKRNRASTPRRSLEKLKKSLMKRRYLKEKLIWPLGELLDLADEKKKRLIWPCYSPEQDNDIDETIRDLCLEFNDATGDQVTKVCFISANNPIPQIGCLSEEGRAQLTKSFWQQIEKNLLGNKPHERPPLDGFEDTFGDKIPDHLVAKIEKELDGPIFSKLKKSIENRFSPHVPEEICEFGFSLVWMTLVTYIALTIQEHDEDAIKLMGLIELMSLGALIIGVRSDDRETLVVLTV